MRAGGDRTTPSSASGGLVELRAISWLPAIRLSRTGRTGFLRGNLLRHILEVGEAPARLLRQVPLQQPHRVSSTPTLFTLGQLTFSVTFRILATTASSHAANVSGKRAEVPAGWIVIGLGLVVAAEVEGTGDRVGVGACVEARSGRRLGGWGEQAHRSSNGRLFLRLGRGGA